MLALPAAPTRRGTGSSRGAGRPTTANAYTGSVSTTRCRSSVTTHGRARARWSGWVEGRSPTTRSTSGRSTYTHGLRRAAANASRTWRAAPGGKATWWNTRPSRRSSPRAPSSTTAGPVRPPASSTAQAMRSRRPVATSTGMPAASRSRMARTEAGWMRSAASERVPSRSVTTSWTAPLPRGSGTGMERAYPLLPAGRPGRGRRALLDQPEAVVEPAQGGRGPPVPAAHQLHGRRDQQHPDHGGVEQDRDGHAQTHLLDGQQLPGGEAEEHDHDQGRRRGDDPPGALQAEGDRPVVVAGLVPGLLDPRQQEHLVVHGQAEGEHEDQHRDGDVDHARGVEAERPREVAFLEHPDQGPEAGPERQKFMTIALTGTTTDPVIRNSRAKVASPISPSAYGSRPT